jgi:hypothetical protein
MGSDYTGPRLHTPAPPFNRWGVRLGNSTGGETGPRGPFVAAIEGTTSYARMPQNTLDGSISYERMPWWRQGYMAPPATLVNWTDAGPRRASLHMRDVTMRRMEGTSNTRAQDPVPQTLGINDGNGSLPGAIRQLNSAGYEVPTNTTPHGLHTRVRGTVPQNTSRLYAKGVQTMRPGRQNRLSNSRGAGQSYSQTTVHQGGGR